MAKRNSAEIRRVKELLNLNDRYFTKHFATLVRKHGGKWIVLSEGKLIGIGESKDLPGLMQKARAASPTPPFMAPIPTPEELQCVL
jgi:hypothetical protein